VTEKLSRKIHIVQCDFAIKQRFLLNFFGLQQQTNTFLANVNPCSRSLYVVVGTSVCPSVVCNVGAPYSHDGNFPQFFHAFRYLAHPLTSS